MEFSRLFGGYIDFPGETHVMGHMACERKPYKHNEFSVVLAKRYHSPAEEFSLRLGWRNYSFFLSLTLVPEQRLWIAFAAVLTLAAYCLGRAEIDLLGEHRWTGGNYDFYVHGPIPYVVANHWEPRSPYWKLAYWGRWPREDWDPKHFGRRRRGGLVGWVKHFLRA